MSEELTVNAEAENDAGHTDEGNLSFTEAVNARLAQQIDEPEQVTEEEPEPEAELSEDAAIEEEEAEETNFPVDLDSLTEDETAALAKALNSKAVARFGKLTAKRKAAEEETVRLRTQLEQKPEFSEPALEANPYGDIATIAELNEKYGETTKFIEEFRGVIDDNEDALADEHIYTEGDKSWTKKEVKAALRNAEKTKDKFLPARLNEIKQEENLNQQAETFKAQATKELEWMADEESPLRTEYESYMDSPVVKEVMAKVPKFRPLMAYMVSHAVNSAKGGTTKKLKAPVKPKLEPSSPVKSSAAPSSTVTGELGSS
jgi:hypothetical protein